jgi:hypothetical protein
MSTSHSESLPAVSFTSGLVLVNTAVLFPRDLYPHIDTRRAQALTSRLLAEAGA